MPEISKEDYQKLDAEAENQAKQELGFPRYELLADPREERFAQIYVETSDDVLAYQMAKLPACSDIKTRAGKLLKQRAIRERIEYHKKMLAYKAVIVKGKIVSFLSEAMEVDPLSYMDSGGGFKDLEDIPPEVRQKMDAIEVENVPVTITDDEGNTTSTVKQRIKKITFVKKMDAVKQLTAIGNLDQDNKEAGGLKIIFNQSSEDYNPVIEGQYTDVTALDAEPPEEIQKLLDEAER